MLRTAPGVGGEDLGGWDDDHPSPPQPGPLTKVNSGRQLWHQPVRTSDPASQIPAHEQRVAGDGGDVPHHVVLALVELILIESALGRPKDVGGEPNRQQTMRVVEVQDLRSGDRSVEISRGGYEGSECVGAGLDAATNEPEVARTDPIHGTRDRRDPLDFLGSCEAARVCVPTDHDDLLRSVHLATDRIQRAGKTCCVVHENRRHNGGRGSSRERS